MKKVLSIALIAMLVFSFGTMSVFAESDTLTGAGSKTIDVKAKYTDGVTTPTVYSVDLTWGAMEFTYSVSGTKTWNPSTHVYDVVTTPTWTAAGNTVTVTNHSNAAVTAAFVYAKAAGFDGVNGTFNNASLPLLATVEGSAVGSAPSGSTTLTLDGTLANTVTNFTKVGTITVTLS